MPNEKGEKHTHKQDSKKSSKKSETHSESGSSKVTTDPEEIRRWAEERGGHPATVKSTEKNGEPGLLRIDFPGYSGGQSLEEISWDDFFEKFEEKNLSFLYQDETKDGRESRFFKLVNRDSVEDAGSSKRRKAS